MMRLSEGTRVKRLEFLGYLALSVAEKLDPKAREQITETLRTGFQWKTAVNDPNVVRDLKLIEAIDQGPESSWVPGYGFRLTGEQRRCLHMFLTAGM